MALPFHMSYCAEKPKRLHHWHELLKNVAPICHHLNIGVLREPITIEL